MPFAALCFCGTALAQKQSDNDPETLFQRIKSRISEHLSQMPNYTCHETIERMFRIGSTWRHQDTVELEVAFVDQQELFSRPGENKFGEQPIERIVPAGTISNSALGSHIDIIFGRDGTEFKYAGTSKKDGRKTYRYDLRVPIEKSTFRVRHGSAEGMAGYEGSVWLDAETLDLVRVDFKVNHIPHHLGVELIEESMHYKKLTIGNTEFDLPDHSELAATDDLGNYSLNMVKLDQCREFGAQSVVKYGAPSSQGSPSQGSASREAKNDKDH
jgi:hypothetical protein